jgi:hypothetical protein
MHSRTTLACALSLVTLFAGGMISPQSEADADEGTNCNFRVSAPRVETGPGGATVVTATFEVVSCPGTWQPTKSSICIAPESGGGRCSIVYGWGPGRVSVAASPPTGVYETTGQGCARVSVEIDQCVSLAPVRASV